MSTLESSVAPLDILSFPDEILCHIFGYCTADDLVALVDSGPICKQLHLILSYLCGQRTRAASLIGQCKRNREALADYTSTLGLPENFFYENARGSMVDDSDPFIIYCDEDASALNTKIREGGFPTYVDGLDDKGVIYLINNQSKIVFVSHDGKSELLEILGLYDAEPNKFVQQAFVYKPYAYSCARVTFKHQKYYISSNEEADSIRNLADVNTFDLENLCWMGDRRDLLYMIDDYSPNLHLLQEFQKLFEDVVRCAKADFSMFQRNCPFGTVDLTFVTPSRAKLLIRVVLIPDDEVTPRDPKEPMETFMTTLKLRLHVHLVNEMCAVLPLIVTKDGKSRVKALKSRETADRYLLANLNAMFGLRLDSPLIEVNETASECDILQLEATRPETWKPLVKLVEQSRIPLNRYIAE